MLGARSCHDTAATAPRMRTDPIATSHVAMDSTTPTAPYVRLPEMIVDEK